MVQRWSKALKLLLVAVLAVPGCALRSDQRFEFDPDLGHFKDVATEIEYPDVESDSYLDAATTPAPITIRDESPPEYWDLTLQEAIQTSLLHSQVLRDLGGQVLLSSEVRVTRTSFDPAVGRTDPRIGVNAALSAFDASLEASAFFENNDRALNNVFFGGGTRILRQDLHSYQAELSKHSVSGGRFALRKIVDYDLNNQPGNDDPNRPWLVRVEGEFRQPLLHGAGVDFNRIAGPNRELGTFNGVLLARIDTDINLTDFEVGVRNMVNDVETAYWELYFTYRDLDAKISARNRALETWRSIRALYDTKRRGGEAEKEAQAREQYFRLEDEVQNALTGRLSDRIRTTVFQGKPGVQTAERRLRRMMGIAVNDGRLIRPADSPTMARIAFNWDEILVEALNRRVELRRQKWRIKRRELEVIASRNYLLPRVDAVGRYRWRGLGHQLINSERQPDRFNNAYQDLTTGDFQEWQLGVEVSLPVGFRKAHAAVRHAELWVAREKAILEQQEKDIVHDLSDAIGELDRAYANAQTNYNRWVAAQQQLAALEATYQDADEGEKTRLLDLVLDAQRRVSDSETNYYRALLEHTLAIKNVHLQKGSLLDYDEVYLAEGPWPEQAYYDAAARAHTAVKPPSIFGRLRSVPWPLSTGPYFQRTETGDYIESPSESPMYDGERAIEPEVPADPGIPADLPLPADAIETTRLPEPQRNGNFPIDGDFPLESNAPSDNDGHAPNARPARAGILVKEAAHPRPPDSPNEQAD